MSKIMKKRRLSTKEKILQSTLRLLSIDQLESIKYDDIAKEAKISRTLIYHYFPDKDCLYKTLLGEILTFINEITSSVDYSKKAKESLKDLYTKIINAIDGPQNKSTKIFAFISLGIRGVSKFGTFDDSNLPFERKKLFTIIKTLIEKGQADGDFVLEDSTQLTVAMMSMISGMSFRKMYLKEKFKHLDVNIIMNLLLRKETTC